MHWLNSKEENIKAKYLISKVMRKIFVIIILVISFTACHNVGNKMEGNSVKPFINSDIEKQVELVYKRMTMDEKVAQLCGIRPVDLLENNKLSLPKCREKIPNGIGHVCQYACGVDMGPEELRDFVRDLQNYLINETPSGIPAIFHEEAITGIAAKGATIYPQQLGVACTWNTELASSKQNKRQRPCVLLVVCWPFRQWSI
jgi:beta-glucosidase